MWCQKTERRVGAIAILALLGVTLAGCSTGLYLDRRDSIALGAGDAVEANKVAQVIDPWPAHSGNTNIAYNGERMQSAVERYRHELVTPPIDPMMMQVANPTPTTPQTGGPQALAPASTAAPAAGSSAPTNTSAPGQ
jgi:hypothetical protein